MRQACRGVCFSYGVTLFLIIASLTLCSISTASSESLKSQTDEISRVRASGESLRWAILLDLNRTTLTVESITRSVEKYASEIEGSKHSFFAEKPIILNSNGSSATALSKVYDLISNGSKLPDVLFLAESVEVSMSTINILRSSEAAAGMLVISIGASNEILCNPSLNPRLVCLVPQDITNFRGVLEVASVLLRWETMALIFSSSEYGTNFQKIVSTQLQEASHAPTILGVALMNPVGTQAEDDALLEELVLHKPKAIACFVDEKQLGRLREAVQRTHLDVFLLGSREALGALKQMNGTYQPYVKPYGALFVSAYTTAEELVAKEYFSKDTVDEYGAYLMSHLFDGMHVLVEGGTGNMSALRAVRFVGFTGTVAFDPLHNARTETRFAVVLDQYRLPNPLVAWKSGNYSSRSVVEPYDPVVTAALIPRSPLRGAVVCLAVPPTCADTVLASAMLFVLLWYNRQHAGDASAATFLPVAFNAGLDGVAGLSALAGTGIGHTCTVLGGPGRITLTTAFTPIVNSYQIPQLDYAATDNFLTSEGLSYPFFSRTAPPDSFVYFAYSGTCKYFAWERVIILSTAGSIGSSRAKTMSNLLESQNIYVEKTFFLQNNNKSYIVEALNEIYKLHISRIILVILSLSGEDAEMFFNLIDELPFMGKYVFFLSNDLCLHGEAYPEQRNKLQSSICLSPYVPADHLADLNAKAKANPDIFQDIESILRDGNLVEQAETCSIKDIKSITGFAVDAAYVLIDTIERALAANISIKAGESLLSLLRKTSIDNFTEACTVGSEGDRSFAMYDVNIQIPGSVLSIGLWDTRNKQPFTRTYSSSFVWMTNSTSIPFDTFRDYSFILDNTMTASSGTILLCVLGFLVTFALFSLCYQHYRIQTQIEMALLSNNIPITEAELRHLKGIQDDI